MPIDRKTGESKDEFISRCISIEIKDGRPEDQAAAICYAKWEEFAEVGKRGVIVESYSDYPNDVKANAKNVLDWTESNGWGSCGTPVGKQRANQLANGEPISVDTIQRMYSYLTRHEVDLETSQSYSDGCGKLMYDAWGGKSALSWSRNKLRELGMLEASATASVDMPPANIEFAKISIDYDETLSTDRGMELAKRLIAEGNDLYIISARRDKAGMLTRASLLGIPTSRVFATGSNKAKAEKVKELGIKKHYDNNADVVKILPGVGEKFKAVRKVLFDEDFDFEKVKEYKELGFKVYVRSKRKIKKADKKLWNKLKVAGLSEDNLLFGEIPQLDKKWDFESIEIGEDPILEKLIATAKSIKGKHIVQTFDIENMGDAEAAELQLKNVEMRFRTVKVYYTYELRDDVSGSKVIPTTRDFCRRLLDQEGRAWTLDQIKNLSGEHLTKMGLPNDVFQFRGGFYRVKGTLNTTPFCRHIWRAKIVIE